MKRRQKNCILLVCSLLAFANFSYSQKSDVSKLLEANAHYFSPLRENVHLHLNKTTFIIGEHVWYTAYLYDQNKQEPSQATSNLHVALMDANGLKISKQLIHIKNGIGQGDFLLDNTLLDSSYFIIAWTEWMKNFEDVQPFVQEIKILNTKGDTRLDNEYQPYMEIIPEGGRILSENDNTVGFKIRNLKGSQNVISSIKLVNSNGQTIVDNISVNEADEGKFRYYQKSDESYSLHVLLNNKIYIKKSLPKAAGDGIKMEVSSTHPTYHTLTVIADPGLLEKENTVYLAIRQNERMFIKEQLLNASSTQINLLKSSLYVGINLITLFDSDFIPRSERMIFNDLGRGIPADYLKISGHQLIHGDSLQLILEAGDDLASMLYMSISVLPLQSLASHPQNSLISSFKVKPYIGALPFNPVFNKFELSRKDLYSFDISLLCKGSGRYPWTTIVADEHDVSFAFENNIPFKGRILDADLSKENKVWFFSVKSNNGFYADLNSDKTFSGNEILFSGDSLRISVFGENGKLRKPRVEIRFLSLLDKDSIWYKKFMALRSMYPVTINRNFMDKSYSLENKLPDSSKTIFLDEVVVTDRKANPRDIAINSAIHSGKRITDEDIRQSVTVVNYLRKLGYKIAINGGNVSVLSRTIPPGPNASHIPVPVTIGGMLIDGSELVSMPLSRVQSIFYDNMGYRYIALNPYPGHYSQKNKKGYISFPVNNGFTSPREYFNPGYANYQSNEFRKYGVINWFPKVTLRKNGSAKIKIPTMNQKSFLIYIEGMGSDGILISKEEIIELGDNKIGN